MSLKRKPLSIVSPSTLSPKFTTFEFGDIDSREHGATRSADSENFIPVFAAAKPDAGSYIRAIGAVIAKIEMVKSVGVKV